jgi:peroxiredoxin Q/BCP
LKTKLQVGDKAPDITLNDHHGSPVRLADRIGERVLVVYFYPKDHSPGCTMEACAFRDSYERFQEAGADVIGISSGSGESQASFARRNRLPYTLLSDRGDVAHKAFGVGKVLGIFRDRVTFVIDRQGTIRYVFASQINIEGHISEALKIVRDLMSEPS